MLRMDGWKKDGGRDVRIRVLVGSGDTTRGGDREVERMRAGMVLG
jgi:hypothetical protein